MEELIAAITRANEDEIEKILRTAICRKRELYPGWDIEYRARLKEQDVNLKPGKAKKARRRLHEKSE